MPRGDHLAGTAGAHQVADLDRGDVRATLVHPSPHRGVQRHVADLHQHLALTGLADGLLSQLPIARLRKANRSRGEPDLVIDVIQGCSSVIWGLGGRVAPAYRGSDDGPARRDRRSARATMVSSQRRCSPERAGVCSCSSAAITPAALPSRRRRLPASKPASRATLYLVSLFPRRLLAELGVDVELRRRRVSSYTPLGRCGCPDLRRRGAHT